MRRPLHQVRTGLAAVAGVLAFAASGCSDDDAPATGPTAPTQATATAPGVDVPRGVTLTEAGASLELGERGSAVYATGKRASVLSVTVTEVNQGSMRDFKSFGLTARQRASTPYYVDARVTNEGPGELVQSDVPLYGFDSTDTAFRATTLVGSFDRCAMSPLPTRFGPNDSLRTCLVYVVPPKAKLESVQLRTSKEVEPISWPVR